jgi:hypothetical protein
MSEQTATSVYNPTIEMPSLEQNSAETAYNPTFCFGDAAAIAFASVPTFENGPCQILF